MNPYTFDNAQMLQDSVTPEAPTHTPQIPTITNIAEPVSFKVKYKANFLINTVFQRSFTSLPKALDFIKLKAHSKGAYTHFELEIL